MQAYQPYDPAISSFYPLELQYGTNIYHNELPANNIQSASIRLPAYEIHQPKNHARMKKTDVINYIPIFIEKLFKIDSISAQNSIPISVFIQNYISRTRISTNTMITAMLYLDRLKRLHPRCKGSPGSGYRLILSATILAAKYIYDDTFDNSAWATVSSGFFELQQVNQMEMEMLDFLGFRLFISSNEWSEFYAAVYKRVMSKRLTSSTVQQ